jgi:hypothetical protein
VSILANFAACARREEAVLAITPSEIDAALLGDKQTVKKPDASPDDRAAFNPPATRIPKLNHGFL